MRRIARLVYTALSHPEHIQTLEGVREQVRELTRSFPLYSDLSWD